MRSPSSRLLLAAVIWAASVASLRAGDDFEKEPIRYSAAVPNNLVSQLQKRLDAGKAKLEFEDHFGYLRSVLKELQVPTSSQMLVYSKTSLQRNRISPHNPRSIYYNDNLYLGFCQKGEVLEISAVDPELGTVFYTLEQTPSKKPVFMRQTDACTLCHGSSQTHGVPGHIVRSVFSDPEGYPILSGGSYRIDQSSPLKNRWGGWYVTGSHGKQTHLGNLIVRTRQVPDPLDNSAGLNVSNLGERIDRSCFLTGDSDIVALMVLEHQAEAHNLLTRASFETRMALHQEAALNRELGEKPEHRWDSTKRRIESAGEELVRYLLFCEETPLTDRIQGTSSFARDFAQRGPRDDKGRSLRDFDLHKRLFKYPCSYLVYSPSFDALPAPVKDHVLRRLWEVLTSRDTTRDFSHLNATDRQAIREILVATKPNLPAYWRSKDSAEKR